jgi:hypothetical protein
VVEAVINVITRHPMRREELEVALEELTTVDLAVALATLEASGRARRVQRIGDVFWVAAGSAFPESEQSQRTDPRRFASRRHSAKNRQS